MIRYLLSLAVATAAFAQIPADTLRTKLYEKLTAYRQFLEENPGAVEERRLEDAIHLRLAPGQYRALFARGVAYADSDTHEITPTVLDLYETEQGWRTVGSPIVVRVIPGPLLNGNPTTEVQTYRKDPGDGSVTGYGIVMAPVAYHEDLAFRFTQQGIPWQITVNEYGWDLQARVTAPQGAKLYQFGYRELGMTLAPDADGNLATANGRYRITRAVMLRADGVETQCGPWQRDAQRVGFVCDDSAFPAEAFPYVIDPSAAFTPPAGGDDLYITGGDFSWPVADDTPEKYAAGSTVDMWISSGGGVPEFYSIRNYAGRFDTSSLPDDAAPASATLTVRVGALSLPDGAASFSLKGSWDTSGVWQPTYWFSQSELGTAFTTSVSPWAAGTQTISLTENLDDISTVGYTALQMGLYRDTPPSSNTSNYVRISTRESSNSSYWPTLAVDYVYSPTVTSSAPVNGGRVSWDQWTPFTLVAHDGDGYANLDYARMMLSTTSSSSARCWTSYDEDTNVVELRSTNGALLYSAEPGTGGVYSLPASQPYCDIDTSRSTVSCAGNDCTITFMLRVHQNLGVNSGTYNLHTIGYVRDNNSHYQNWTELTSWTLAAPGGPKLIVVSQ